MLTSHPSLFMSPLQLPQPAAHEYVHPTAASHVGFVRFILGPGGLQEAHEPPTQQQPLVCSCGLAWLQAASVVKGLHLFCWVRRRRPASGRSGGVCQIYAMCRTVTFLPCFLEGQQLVHTDQPMHCSGEGADAGSLIPQAPQTYCYRWKRLNSSIQPKPI
jgi:hypothetical protein